MCFPSGETRIALYLEENGNSQNAILQLDYEVYECGTNNLIQAETRIEVELSDDPITGGCEPFDGWYTTCPLPNPPVITGISPNAGPVGQAVTVSCTNLGSVNFPSFTEAFMELQGSGVRNPPRSRRSRRRPSRSPSPRH